MGFDRFRDLVGELYTVSCQCGNTGVSVVEIRLLMRNRSYTEVLIPSNISPLPFIARVFNTVWAHTRPGQVNDPQERSRGQSALCMTEERQSIHLIQREILSEIKKRSFTAAETVVALWGFSALKQNYSLSEAVRGTNVLYRVKDLQLDKRGMRSLSEDLIVISALPFYDSKPPLCGCAFLKKGRDEEK